VESRQLIVLREIGDLDGIAANFAIFGVCLARNGEIEDHRDLLAAVRAHEGVFHRDNKVSHLQPRRKPATVCFWASAILLFDVIGTIMFPAIFPAGEAK
jgi:hypothetical protein